MSVLLSQEFLYPSHPRGVTVKLEIRGNLLDITIPSDHFPLTVIIPIFGLVQRLDFANISIVHRVAALTPRLTLS